MRLQMKEEPGAEVNTQKTSIRRGGNPHSSLLRSASPHLGRAGDPRSRRLAIQSRPAAGSPGAVPRRSAAAAAAAAGRHPRAGGRQSRVRAAAGRGEAGGGGRRSLPIHCAWQPGERAPAAPRQPAPSRNSTRGAHWLRAPWRHPAAELSERREGESLGPRWPRPGGGGPAASPAPRSPFAARRRGTGDAVPGAGESPLARPPPASPGSGFGKECAGSRPGPTARRGVCRSRVSPPRKTRRLLFPLPHSPSTPWRPALAGAAPLTFPGRAPARGDEPAARVPPAVPHGCLSKARAELQQRLREIGESRLPAPELV